MLNISRNIYSAWNVTSQKNKLPEAEIIPIGNSANEKRKLESVTRQYPNLLEHKNIPLPGFTLFKSNRARYGSIDKTWLVIDPRGFLVRITNENLENILHVTGITEGLIQERCVWARDDTQTKMTLIPISSPAYIEAESNTELLEGKVDLKDVQVGDYVLIQNGLQGIYMGSLSLYGPIYNGSSVIEFKPQAYLRRQILEVFPGKYHYQADLKILKVLKKADIPSTREESALKINDEIKNSTAFLTPGMDFNRSLIYYWVRGIISHVSPHAIAKVKMTFEEIKYDEAKEILYAASTTSDMGRLLLVDSQSKYSLIEFPYNFASSSKSDDSFEICSAEGIHPALSPVEAIILRDSKHGFSMHKNHSRYKLGSFKKFYKIIKHVKGQTYI